MITNVKQLDEVVHVKRYKIRYSVDQYTFPKDALIHSVKIDDKHIHVELTDQRILSIPLWWIPTVHNASAEDRGKFEINQSRSMIVWNPETCQINDEISIADYLGPAREEIGVVYAVRESKRQVAEVKPKAKKVKK
jgi:hypothetical protein